jgi:hypothetical protein
VRDPKRILILNFDLICSVLYLLSTVDKIVASLLEVIYKTTVLNNVSYVLFIDVSLLSLTNASNPRPTYTTTTILLLPTTTTTSKINIDVRHGGYYLITDGIYKKIGPKRIIDFPPDETTLLGCALGFSQLGIIPIVEIPYIKYLDCGIDMFYEIAIQYWLTNGSSSSTSSISINSSNSISSTIGEDCEGEGEDDGTSSNKVGGGGGGIRNEGSSQPILPKRRNGGMIIRLQGTILYIYKYIYIHQSRSDYVCVCVCVCVVVEMSENKVSPFV